MVVYHPKFQLVNKYTSSAFGYRRQTTKLYRLLKVVSHVYLFAIKLWKFLFNYVSPLLRKRETRNQLPRRGKVLYITPQMYLGGLAQTVAGQALELQEVFRKYLDLVIFVSEDTRGLADHEEVLKTLSLNGVAVVRISPPDLYKKAIKMIRSCFSKGVLQSFAKKSEKFLFNKGSEWNLFWQIWRLNPDIVHGYHRGIGRKGMIYASIQGVKTILYTVVDNYTDDRYSAMTPKEVIIWRTTNSLATGIHTISESQKEVETFHGNDASKYYTIRVGIDTEFFQRGGIIKDKLRKKYSVDPQAHVVLTVGRLFEDKGQLYAIKAIAEIIKEFPGTLYLMIGEQNTSYAVRIREAVSVLGLQNHVRIIQPQKALIIREYLALSDVFVHPSPREGLGRVTLEARAMELPVVLFDFLTARETCPEGTGFVVPLADFDAIAEAVKFLFRHPLIGREMGARAREDVVKRFNRQSYLETFRSWALEQWKHSNLERFVEVFTME